jgi:RNA polymerase sigma factor (sigma-70 family)
MEDSLTASSVDDVLATEPVIRRVVAARVSSPADVDDFVQDCLERLLSARSRLAPETLLPYGIVTARNLVISHARHTSRWAAAAPRMADGQEPARPEDALLVTEARRAMTVALAQLPDQERDDLLAYYDGPRSQPPGTQESGGALRVRMSRTRAKMRLEYLLAFRQVTLPTQACRRVLLAISAGDTRRQREANAGQHLLDCATCAELSGPLDRRSLALTAFTLPAGLAAWFLARARAHPVQAASATAGAATVAAAAILGPGLLTPRPPPVHHPRTVAAAPASPRRVIPRLDIGGKPVYVGQSIRARIGQHAHASGVLVQDVVTHNGFWVGSSRARIWVELVGPLRAFKVRPGDRVQFTGTVIGNGHSYAARIGVTGKTDADQLNSQGAHLDVRTSRIHKRP